MNAVRKMMPALFVATHLAWGGDLVTDGLEAFGTAAFYQKVIIPNEVSVSTNGHVLKYTFTASGSPVTDESGSNNIGTVVGATWTNSAWSGGGFVFNGNSNYIEAADSASLDLRGPAWTISFWVKLNTAPTTPQAFVAKHDDASNRAYALWAQYGIAVFQCSSDGTGDHRYEFVSGSDIPVGSWCQVVGTWNVTNNPKGKIYFNGVDAGQATLTDTFSGTNIYNSSLPLRVGANGANAWYLQGQMDDVHIFNREMSAAEILARYRQDAAVVTTGFVLRVERPAEILHVSPQGDLGMGGYTNGL